jgi:hypothetical protein
MYNILGETLNWIITSATKVIRNKEFIKTIFLLFIIFKLFKTMER